MSLIGCGYSNRTNTKESDSRIIKNKESEIPKELQGLELKIALVVSEKDNTPRLAFIAKNNGKVDIGVSDFRIGENGVEIVGPNKKRPSYNAEQIGPVKPIVIKPSETKIWFMDPARLLIAHKEDGLYRIKWKIFNVESKEILLLKEKVEQEQVMNTKNDRSNIEKGVKNQLQSSETHFTLARLNFWS